MGEAKHRKETDPDYGRPRKTSTVRGLILSQPVTINGSSLNIGSINYQDLRFSLTYWDRLAVPDNNILSIGSNDEFEYLESCGILHRPFIRFGGGQHDGAHRLQHAQEIVLESYDQKDPGAWAIHGGENSITSARTEISNDGALIELLNAMPVPGADVPLAEILEFKAKRRDELLHFRQHFDNLSSALTSSEKFEEDLQLTLKEIDTSCSNLFKVTREWAFPVKLIDARAYLNFDIDKAVTVAGKTYKSCLETFNLSQTAAVLSATGAAIASQVKFSPEVSFQKIKRPRSPYKYAYLVQRDLQ